MRALTIGELERESGVPRRTIYYCVRIGMLPPAQKASPSRALHTDENLAMLGEIEALRAQGLRPAAVKPRLAGRLEAAGRSGVDLVACYKIAVQYMNGFLRARFEEARDAPERLVWYMYADSGIKAFAPDMFALALGSAQHDEEARRDLREAYETIFREHINELVRRRRSPQAPSFADEHVCHGLMGRSSRCWRARLSTTSSLARGGSYHPRPVPDRQRHLPRRRGHPGPSRALRSSPGRGRGAPAARPARAQAADRALTLRPVAARLLTSK